MKEVYYKKTLPVKKVRVANFRGVSIDLFSKSLPIDYAVKQENLKTLNGVLVATKTPIELKIIFDDKIEKIIPYTDGIVKLLVVCEHSTYILETVNGEFVKTPLQVDFKILDSTRYKYGEEDYLILATDNGLKKFEKGIVSDTEVNYNFDKVCNHYYRIFAAGKNTTKLEFSDDFAPFNWTQSIDEGGYINLTFENGNITDLISFNEYLIASQTDGFTKIVGYSEQEDFVVKSVESPNNIKSNSVVNCGDYIMYATNKGFGIFDGYNCKSINEELSSFLKDYNVQAQACNEYCYFLCKNTTDEFAENYIIAYDLVRKDYHFISCADAKFIQTVKVNSVENLLVVYDNQIKVLMDNTNSETKVWQSGVIDFDKPEGEKLLKKIVFGGKTIIDLKITVDGQNYFYSISNNRSVLLNLKGKEFVLQIEPKGINIAVPSPVLEYQVLEGF